MNLKWKCEVTHCLSLKGLTQGVNDFSSEGMRYFEIPAMAFVDYITAKSHCFATRGAYNAAPCYCEREFISSFL